MLEQDTGQSHMGSLVSRPSFTECFHGHPLLCSSPRFCCSRDGVIIPILQMWKPRAGLQEWCVPGHKGGWGPHLGSLHCGSSREGNILQDKLVFPLLHLAPRTSPADAPMPSRLTLGASSSSLGSRSLRGGDGAPVEAEELLAALCRGRPAGVGGPEKQEGNAQGTLHSRGWKRVWVQTRAPGRGVRFPEGRAGSELTSPHTPGMVPPCPPQPRLYVDPLTHWLGLESLPCARTWGGHHCPLAVSLELGVVGEAGAGLGPFPYSHCAPLHPPLPTGSRKPCLTSGWPWHS